MNYYSNLVCIDFDKKTEFHYNVYIHTTIGDLKNYIKYKYPEYKNLIFKFMNNGNIINFDDDETLISSLFKNTDNVKLYYIDIFKFRR